MTSLHAQAQQVILASHRRATDLGVSISTAVVDPQGRLLAFGRMDDARWLSIDVSVAKAYTAAVFGRTGHELSQLPGDLVGSVAAIQGRGLLAALGTAHVNALYVGCSGARGDQDQDCADHALANSGPGDEPEREVAQ